MTRTEDEDGRRHDGNDPWARPDGKYATSVARRGSSLRIGGLTGNSLAQPYIDELREKDYVKASDLMIHHQEEGTRPAGWYTESGFPYRGANSIHEPLSSKPKTEMSVIASEPLMDLDLYVA